MAEAVRDGNHVPSILFKGSDGLSYPVKGDEATGRLLVDNTSSGTVTSVSVVSANGFAGSVATATTTPAITLSTTITGILKGNGTAISAVTIGSGLSFDGTTLSATGGSGITIGTTTITSGTNTRILYNNAGVVGEYTLTGSGTVVVMQTAPTFATSITTPSVLATANDSGALGASGTAFSDLFLASGGVINWNAGASTITHSLNTLTIGGIGATTLALGTNSLTMTGSIAATGARVTKGWFTDVESTNMYTVGGTSLASTFAALAGSTGQVFSVSSLEVSNTDTTISRSSAGIIAVEGVAVPTISSTDTLSNKTLTAPKIANAGFIADANGNEQIIFTTTASAVNEVTFANAATGGNPNFTASGGDANVGIDFTPKGTGFIQIKGNSTQAGTLAIYEDTDDGSNYSAFRGSARAGNIIYTMPTADPTAGQVLSAGAPSGGVSALSWATAGGSSGWTLVDSQTFSGATSTTVNNNGSNLDGNTDEIYELIVRGVWSNGAEGNLDLRFNSDTSTIYFYTNPYGTDSGSQSVALGALDNKISLTNGSWEHIFVKVTIFAKTTPNKMVVGYATGFDTTGNTSRTTHIGGVYEETSTNITTINLVSSATFASGSQWWLWKKGSE